MIAVNLFRSYGLALSLILSALPAWSQPILEPAANPYGTLGMSNIVSAEAMGAGRLTVNLRGNFYQQQKDFPGAPAKDIQIYTGTGGLAYGVTSFAEVFAALSGYNLSGRNGSGLGTTAFGLQGHVPFEESFPARLGLQLAILPGDAGSQININRADGYNYFETRTGTDLMARLMQSVIFSGRDLTLKLHLNEGVVTSMEKGKDPLFLQGAGIEFLPSPSVILGLEFNSRTYFNDSRLDDPLWVTPSLTFRSQSHLNAQVGADVSITPERDNTPTRALEPWRVFGSLTFSYALLGDKKREAAEKSRLDSLSRIQAELRNKAIADSLAYAAQQDSLTRMRERAIADSVALAEVRRQLEEERNRPVMLPPPQEKKLLSTGMLVLDAVYFETGLSDVSMNSAPYLTQVAKMLTRYPKLIVEVSGHTDNVGSAASNLKLSQERAEAAVKVMLDAEPELDGRLKAKGYGFSQPKASNKTAAGRKLNRRTELQVLNKSVLKEYR